MYVKEKTILLGIWLLSVEVPARIIETLKLNIPLNHTIDLKCGKNRNHTIASIVWRKKPFKGRFQTIYTHDQSGMAYIHPQFISTVRTHKSDRLQLTNGTNVRVKNLQLRDSGLWECNVIYIIEEAIVKERMALYRLDVISPPMPVSVETSFLAVHDGLKTTVFCDSQSKSPFNVSWHKQFGSFTQRTTFKEESSHHDGLYIHRVYMQISRVSEADAGSYTCVAQNIAARQSKDVLVKLKKPPIFTGPSEYNINLFEPARLACVAKGYPKMRFSWIIPGEKQTRLDDKRPQTAHYRMKLSKYNKETDEQVSWLIINNLRRLDHGLFQCIASNEMGIQRKDVKVYGSTTPDAPTIIDYTTTENSVTLNWQVNNNGGMKVTYFTIQHKYNSSRKWEIIKVKAPANEFTVFNLPEETLNEFRMFASNSIGVSEASEILIVYTKNPLLMGSNTLIGNLGLTTFIGICGGALIALCCGLVCTSIFVRKMSKSETNFNERASNTNPSHAAVTGVSFEMEPLFQTADEWEFPRDKLNISTVIGAGAFGVVMCGIADGIKGSQGNVKVAVKTVRDGSNEAATADLLAELNLLKIIPKHENVIGLLGCCTRSGPLFVIVEYCDNGDLQGFLRSSRGIYERYYRASYRGAVPNLTSKMLLMFAQQIAKGMSQLANMKVIHRDLAARNILVDEHLICKVSDFGFARDVYVEDHYMKRSAGGRFPIKWMAIESLLDGISTSKSDVWGFGVVLWELVTLGASPYPGMNSHDVVSFLQEGNRMDKPKHCDNDLYSVMVQCWNGAANRRPSFEDLSEKLQHFINDDKEFINMCFYQDHLYVNFDLCSSTSTAGAYCGTPKNSLNLNIDLMKGTAPKDHLQESGRSDSVAALSERSMTGHSSVSNASESAALLLTATK